MLQALKVLLTATCLVMAVVMAYFAGKSSGNIAYLIPAILFALGAFRGIRALLFDSLKSSSPTTTEDATTKNSTGKDEK